MASRTGCSSRGHPALGYTLASHLWTSDDIESHQPLTLRYESKWPLHFSCECIILVVHFPWPGGKGHRWGERRPYFTDILSHSLCFTFVYLFNKQLMGNYGKNSGRSSRFPLWALTSFVYVILCDLISEPQALVVIIITQECNKNADSRLIGLVWVLTLYISRELLGDIVVHLWTSL